MWRYEKRAYFNRADHHAITTASSHVSIEPVAVSYVSPVSLHRYIAAVLPAGRSRYSIHKILSEESPGSMDTLPGNAWARGA